MAKDDSEAFGFGGKGTGGEFIRDYWNKDAWNERNGRKSNAQKNKFSGKDGSTQGYDVFKENRDDKFALERAIAMGTGSWVASANKHAEKLYTEDNMDYNDMKKYGAMAGVSDINSKADVKAIRKAYNNAHTSEDEMQSAISAMRDELTESVENGGDQTAAEGTTFNEYLESSEAGSQPETAAQSMLSNKVKAIASDKETIGRAKAGQGKYVLQNLGSDEFRGGTDNV